MLKIVTRIRKLFPTNPSEIKIIYHILNAKHQPGLMIDVGAHYGESFSIFADSGWEVHAFEPDLENRQKLEMRLGNSRKVVINSSAVSNKNERLVDFYANEVSTGVSGLLAFHSGHVYAGTVNTITLDKYIKEKKIDVVDLLKIDAEGYDLFVLKGLLSLNEIRPEMIICEFEDSKSTLLGYTFHDMALFLQEHKYKLMVSEWYPIIEYGTQHYWRKFIEYPCDLSDPDAWGNIFAVKNSTKFDLLRNKCDNISTRKKFSRMIMGKKLKACILKTLVWDDVYQ